jgi:NhaA family Na+:H+ antiporter
MFINDFLMSIFFLVAGLEIKHEILYGNLSTLKKASFPVIASCGGVIVPAIIYYIFNKNTPFIKK